MHEFIDHYTTQPTGAPFDSMALAHFAVWYDTVSGSEVKLSEDTSGCFPCFQLQNNIGSIAKRCHQACRRTTQPQLFL